MNWFINYYLIDFQVLQIYALFLKKQRKSQIQGLQMQIMHIIHIFTEMRLWLYYLL